MTRRRNPPHHQRKDNESVASATELMDVTKLSEMELRVTMVKMMCRLEKNINENINKNIQSLRAEMSESGRN